MSTRTIETPIGALTLTASADAVTAVRFGAQGARDASALLDAAEAQLHEYFARTRRTFDLPLDPRGTAFELRVWAALCTIPYGETRSYGAIAAARGQRAPSAWQTTATRCRSSSPATASSARTARSRAMPAGWRQSAACWRWKGSHI